MHHWSEYCSSSLPRVRGLRTLTSPVKVLRYVGCRVFRSNSFTIRARTCSRSSFRAANMRKALCTRMALRCRASRCCVLAWSCIGANQHDISIPAKTKLVSLRHPIHTSRCSSCSSSWRKKSASACSHSLFAFDRRTFFFVRALVITSSRVQRCPRLTLRTSSLALSAS